MCGPGASQALPKPRPEVPRQRSDEWAGIAYAEQARSKKPIHGETPGLRIESTVPVLDLLLKVRQVQKTFEVCATPSRQLCQMPAESEQTLGNPNSQRPARRSRLRISEL